MKINQKLSIILLSMLTEICFANCDAILSQAMYNITISKSTGLTIATKYFNNCGKDFSYLSDSQLAQVEVEIFGYGSGGGGVSRTKREERLREWCITNKETAFKYEDRLEETRTIYAESVRAWENCNSLASRDVQVEPIVSEDQKIVSYAMRYTGPTTSGVIFFGVMRAGFTCTVKPYDTVLKKVVPFDPKNPPEIGRINTPVHCTRKAAVTKTINGQQYSYLASGNITLQTGSYNVMMSFPEVYDPPLPEAKADALQKQITALEKKLVPQGTIAMWSGTISTIPSGWELADGSCSIACPDLRDKFIAGATIDVDNIAMSTVTNVPLQQHETGIVKNHSHTVWLGGPWTGPGNGNGINIVGQWGGSAGKFDEGAILPPIERTTKNVPPFYALAFIIKTANNE